MRKSAPPLHESSSNGKEIQPFEALDAVSSRHFVSTRNRTVEISKGNPFEPPQLTVRDQHRNCWKGFGGGSEGGMLPGGSIMTTQQGAVVHPDDYEQVYVRSLMATLRGYPIWFPTTLPREGVPLEFSRKGQLVGDVGLVGGHGSFVSFFNIFLPADHPLNKGRVPDNFVPFPVNHTELVTRRTFHDSAYIVSPSVRVAHKDQSGSDERSAIQFEANGPEGAILGLPCGATSEDLVELPGLRQYIADNIFSWYVYLREVKYRRPFNGDIRVIIGTDKSTSWTRSTFVSPDGTSDDDFRVEFTNILTRDGLRTSFKFSGTCLEIMGGPEPDFLDEVRDPDDNISDYCSHTVFIRTLNILLSDDYWEAYLSGDKSPSAIRTSLRRGFVRSTSLLSTPLYALDQTFNVSSTLNKFLLPKQSMVTITGVSAAVQASLSQIMFCRIS